MKTAFASAFVFALAPWALADPVQEKRQGKLGILSATTPEHSLICIRIDSGQRH